MGRDPMTGRRRPPNRRGGETFDIVHDGQRYAVTIGPLEVFVRSEKTSSALEALARDGSILISFALQYGAPLDELRKAITRGDHEEPATVIGAVLDAMETPP